MELTNSSFPIRAFIRHKAKVRIINPFNTAGLCPSFDEKLLKELAATLFRSTQWRESFRPYPTREAADAVEDDLAADLAEMYRRVKQNQADPLVQRLNALLSSV